MAENLQIVYVPLLDEGTTVSRPTQARHIQADLFEILPTPDYNPDDEHWQFLPHSIVQCAKQNDTLIAIALAPKDSEMK
jgi:hypothetical protein